MAVNEILKERKLPEIWSKEQLDWNVRREEIKDILQREEYGYRPGDPEEITFTELPKESFYDSFCAGKAPLKKIEIKVKISRKEFAFPVYAVVPKDRKNLPFFIHINFRDDVPDRYMPTEEIVDNGFAVFSFCYKDVTSDDDDFGNGLAGVLYDGRERSESDCGKIAMWSWAASRVMDYCETLDCLDRNKSAVIGHSRLGKTALFTGMMDERFQFVISNNSGCSGAAISRGKVGESIERINQVFPYWFAPNYQKYNGKEEEMPFDQHFLLAASAPRHVYVASALEDTWADPDSEYLSCCAAGEVYESIGMKGFVHPNRLPVSGDVLQEGSVGYHLRSGCHYLGREDWNRYFAFILNK